MLHDKQLVILEFSIKLGSLRIPFSRMPFPVTHRKYVPVGVPTGEGGAR